MVTGERSQEAFTWREYVTAAIYSPLLIFQIVLFFFFYQNELGLDALFYLGLLLWALSIVFGIAPIITFRRRGGVAKGESYVRTTKLVTTGIYSIVRHPQYVAGPIWNVALVLVTQHWLSLIAGAIAFIAFYIDILRADPPMIEKFGDEYRRYMEEVPRANFVLGIVRRLAR